MKKTLTLTLTLLIPICGFSRSLYKPAATKFDYFKLEDVRLGESTFKHAQDLDKKYILTLNPDKLLAPYYKEAGLEPKAENYTNWENTGLDGHIGGHYLSALALMYASTGDEDIKQRFDYYIKELKKLQASDGYLCGVPNGREIWKDISEGKINAGSFSLNGRWVPLYNIHKIYSGLYDAYVYAGSEDAKDMLIKLCDWMIDVTKNLSDEQIETMMISEYGGLNEVFANVASITKNDKYLDLAVKFSQKQLVCALSHEESLKQCCSREPENDLTNDILTGMHANTQIPKVIGYKSIADYMNAGEYILAVDYFWDEVVKNRSVSIGGNSVREHFHPAFDFTPMLEDIQGPETCNTYNMLKLSKMLFATSGDMKYIDYYERALYNHILSTQHPESGGLVYFTPIRSGHNRKYSQPETSFWCCVGSGIENHAKYSELIYAHRKNNLFVNLFIPSTVNWKERGVTITQTTNFPNEAVTELTVKTKKSKRFHLSMRVPEWASYRDLKVYVNDKLIRNNLFSDDAYSPDNIRMLEDNDYITLSGKFRNGDVIRYEMNMRLRAERMPDKSDNFSFLYGPIVLANRIDYKEDFDIYADDSRGGHIAESSILPLSEMPKFVGSLRNTLPNITKTANEELRFTVNKDIVYPAMKEDLVLEPFYQIHGDRYAIYFPVISDVACKELVAKNKTDQEKAMKLAAKTVDKVVCGEQQPESDHFIEFEKCHTGYDNNGHWRNTKSYFSYIFKNADKDTKKILISTFDKDMNKSTLISVNGEVIGKLEINQDSDEYMLSVPEHLKNEDELKISVIAEDGRHTHNIYKIFTIRQ